MMYLSRKTFFSSAHSYRIEAWSEEENLAAFGPCSHIHGHGHDYTLVVMVKGQTDPQSGIVVNIKDIDQVMKSLIKEELDGKFLNKEVDYFQTHIPTTENLVEYIWRRLEGQFANSELHKITLHENDFLYSERGKDAVIRLTRKYHFSSAHRLHSDELSEEDNTNLFGKCNNPYGHGHNYYLEVTVSGMPDPITGMITDLGQLDQIVEEVVLEKFDHKHMNYDIDAFKHVNPTSENVVLVIWNLLQEKLGNLHRIGLYETEKNYFEYFGPDKE